MMIKKQVGRTISLVPQGVGHRITLQGMMKIAASCKPLGGLAAEPVRRLNSLDFVAVDGHEHIFQKELCKTRNLAGISHLPYLVESFWAT